MTAAAMRFSGGKDSVMAALRMAPKLDKLDMLTFTTRMIADADASRRNADVLRAMLSPRVEVRHAIVDIDATAQFLYEPRGWRDNWRRFGSYAVCCMCNACDLAMIVHVVLHCARHGYPLAFDGGNSTEFAGFLDDWGLPKIKQFAGSYGVRWEYPVYGETRTDLLMLERGLRADPPKLLFGSQPRCRGGGTATNLYLRFYYLPRHGADDYRETTLRWLDDRLKLARKLVDAHLARATGTPDGAFG